ncbi:hypothetical protein N0V90_004448 [Kalmusia sp. IMI 367209]|nr:hypothetical protein N0V90_004448 [Kalmusia sp. IMI 367209]
MAPPVTKIISLKDRKKAEKAKKAELHKAAALKTKKTAASKLDPGTPTTIVPKHNGIDMSMAKLEVKAVTPEFKHTSAAAATTSQHVLTITTSASEHAFTASDCEIIETTCGTSGKAHFCLKINKTRADQNANPEATRKKFKDMVQAKALEAELFANLDGPREMLARKALDSADVESLLQESGNRYILNPAPTHFSDLAIEHLENVSVTCAALEHADYDTDSDGQESTSNDSSASAKDKPLQGEGITVEEFFAIDSSNATTVVGTDRSGNASPIPFFPTPSAKEDFQSGRPVSPEQLFDMVSEEGRYVVGMYNAHELAMSQSATAIIDAGGFDPIYADHSFASAAGVDQIYAPAQWPAMATQGYLHSDVAVCFDSAYWHNYFQFQVLYNRPGSQENSALAWPEQAAVMATNNL